MCNACEYLIPRACLTAGEIAGQAEFFSFDTNDLTQMTYGMSRVTLHPSLLYRCQSLSLINVFN